MPCPFATGRARDVADSGGQRYEKWIEMLRRLSVPRRSSCSSRARDPRRPRSSIGIGVVVVDITTRKEAEKAMRFQADLLAAVGQAIVAVDLERTIIYWNKAAELLYGWSAAEAIGRSSVDVIPRQESPDRAAMMGELMRRGETWSGDYEATRRDGSIVAVQVTNTPVFDHDGKLVAVIGSSIDITERRALDQARGLLSAIVDGSGDAIFASTVDGDLHQLEPCRRGAVRLHRRRSDRAAGVTDRATRARLRNRPRCVAASMPVDRTNISRPNGSGRTAAWSTC